MQTQDVCAGRKLWVQGVQMGVEIFFDNAVSRKAGAPVAQPCVVVKLKEETRRCVTAYFSRGQSGQLIPFNTAVMHVLSISTEEGANRCQTNLKQEVGDTLV